MIDISVQNLQKSFGDKQVLRGVSFDVQAGEHIGLLGANGTGKTTLFRILAEEERPDGGSVSVAAGKPVGLLSQIPDFPAHYTSADVLDDAFAPLRAMESEMEDLARDMAGNAGLIKRYGEIAHRFETLGGFETGLRLARVRQGLSIGGDLYERAFESLSGGEKTRVNLARLMLEQPEILLLDEPTNHLDMRSTEWLEKYLSSYRGTVICISHDRYFLDGVVTRIIELEDGMSELYSGNYSFYAEEKAKRYEEKLKKYEQEQREIGRLEAVARRMHDYAGGNAKLHRRAMAIEKRAARVATVDKPRRRAELRQKFSVTKYSADDVLRLTEISKAFDDKPILEKTTLTVRPGEKIALLGDNGAGKTTLFRIILGDLLPDTGRIQPGPAVKMADLPQVVEFSHPERSLHDTMLYEAGCTPQQARDRLGGFHFRGEEVFQRVDTLSGGERSRLKLCILMGESVNLLLLDEPTNHLDIASREWMEEAVEAFGETLVFISHDRYFVSRFATRVWELDNGKITDFHGDYEDFRAWKELSESTEEEPPTQAAPKKQKTPSSKDSKELERRRRALERDMVRLEELDAELERRMAENSSDAAALTELMEQKSETAGQWQLIYAQWEELG